MTRPVLTMQQALLTLTSFWEARGCVVVQPFNTEVGAGTMNPATILRTLGPEPWRVAYVEPSVRPDDSRYGENPNRLQTHTQFQVLLKPEPGNPQELFLDSLAALGIDLQAHDVRFVEDNWAQPAIGAWGLGWEVWLDGMEVTQFTYFQQVGGHNLDPVSVELTYGMERIMMALQQVTDFKEIAYGPGLPYGELFGQSEYEMSRYYLDEADVATNRAMFDAYTAEAARLVEARLPVPAHTFLLKSSHAFNVLDARGAISTTERARAFGTMRRLAASVCDLWLERREEIGFPLLHTGSGVFEQLVGTPVSTRAPTGEPVVATAGTSGPGPQTFVLEIGTEELPPDVVTATVAAVREGVIERLAASSLPVGRVSVAGTPRRVVVTVTEVAPAEPGSVQIVRGPRVSAAYDENGQPTKALLGFARSRGAEVDELLTAEIGGQQHVVHTLERPGRTAGGVLSPLITTIVTSLRADKNMRWSDPALSFSRPIRWLLALLGDDVVPASASALTSGRETYLQRTAQVRHLSIASADQLVNRLAEHGIVVDISIRREQVTTQATALAAGAGGHVDLEGESALVDEITNLVESPTGILGDFDPVYLRLPDEILTTVMRKHQRYLPVRDDTGGLLPHFITFADGDCDREVVRAGNASVLRARYEDAAFFFAADLKVGPTEFRRRLGRLLFTEETGSVDERASRICDVAIQLASLAADPSVDGRTLHRAGELAKFDLASQMVVELSSLAGLMAREYARRAGESEQVAQALWEMELPRSAGDRLPETGSGAVLSLADRFDLLAAMFGTGARPTGSSDPFGLRRAAIGVLAVLRSRPALRAVTVPAGLDIAAGRLRDQGVPIGSSAVENAAEFARGRFVQQLRDEGVSAELVAAVTPSLDTPARVDELLGQIAELAEDPAFRSLVATVQRAARIVPPGTEPDQRPAVLVEPADARLSTALTGAAPHDGTLVGWTRSAAELPFLVGGFFDEVLVLADDRAVRSARLGLLAAVVAAAPAGIDWAALDTALG